MSHCVSLRASWLVTPFTVLLKSCLSVNVFPPSRFALPLISWLVKKVPFVKVIFRVPLSYDAPVKAFPPLGTSTLVAPVSVLASSLHAGFPFASVFQTLFT